MKDVKISPETEELIDQIQDLERMVFYLKEERQEWQKEKAEIINDHKAVVMENVKLEKALQGMTRLYDKTHLQKIDAVSEARKLKKEKQELVKENLKLQELLGERNDKLLEWKVKYEKLEEAKDEIQDNHNQQ